jgi:hypothetical protein
VRQYLQELEPQNPAEDPVLAQDQVSTPDSDSTYAPTVARPARLGYYDNYSPIPAALSALTLLITTALIYWDPSESNGLPFVRQIPRVPLALRPRHSEFGHFASGQALP